MSKITISIDQWPAGIGVSIGNEKEEFFTTIAGPHGGGVGKTIKTWKIDAEELIKIIKEFGDEE